MVKFFPNRRNKDKEKQRIERSKENDFLYGRSKGGRGPQSSAPRNDNRGRHGYGSEAAEGDSARSFASVSTSYDRGESYDAVAARENYNNYAQPEPGHHAISAGYLPKPPPATGYAAKPPPASNYAPKPAAAAAGKMSREEMDRLTKRRMREERQRMAGPKSSFEDRLRESHAIPNGSSHEEDDGEADGGGGPKQPPLTQEEMDRRIKEGVRRQMRTGRKGSYDRDDGVRNDNMRNDNNSGTSELEQRRRRQREQADKDRRIKESVRKQTHAVKELRSSGTRSLQNDADDETDQRKRRQREQADKDRRIKEEVRRQTHAAKEARGGGGVAEALPPPEDELDRRRRRQREQAEQDRRIKESVKRQTHAAKELRSSGTAWAVPRQDDAEDEVEARRRRQREQAEQDRRIKESVRRQTNAAKEMRSSGVHPDPRNNVDEDFEQRRLKRLERAGRPAKQKLVSFSEDSSHDPFETGLQLLPSQERKPARQRNEGGLDMSQNVIDMHIAQLRATSKIASVEDQDYECFEVNPDAALDEFVDKEAEANRTRRESRRMSTTTMKIKAWHQKYTIKKAIELAERTPEMEWLSSFYRCDPRWQIMKFFDEVARDGGEAAMDENLGRDILANLFNKASVFTVWRPTSNEAIKNMMLGIAAGKGLDIKGKSAKKGNISSYVPFIQIYEEDHKEHVRAFIKDGKIVRVFYKTEKARWEAYEMMLDIKDFMLFAAQDAMRVLSDDYADPEEQELAMKHLMYDDVSLNVEFVNTYVDSGDPVWGLDITERLFWESYVMNQYCERPPNTEWDIGRKSEPAYMDMNFKSIRHIPEPDSDDPRAVVYQMCTESPMDPRKLLMAYEECGSVKPVVSDFDCFLLGSRGVKYENPIPKDQIELVKWSVKNISEVLDERVASGSTGGWMDSWFNVLKKAALKGYYHKTPKFGNGDPKSYEIIEVAVSRLQSTGCVRHGPECFNWWFPQDIDEDFLVISDTLPGNLNWKYVKVPELQEILIQKIDEGFTFPINPKWVLCDPGWRRVYDKLLASTKPNVQDSINCWLPPGTGLRERIDEISARHPSGFDCTDSCGVGNTEGTEERDLMEENLERYFKVQRAWRKLRLLLFWIRFAREKRREREEKLARETGPEREERLRRESVNSLAPGERRGF